MSSVNKLHALLGHYNSDEEESEDDDNAEFKNFMNEIKASDNPPQASSTCNTFIHNMFASS